MNKTATTKNTTNQNLTLTIVSFYTYILTGYVYIICPALTS